MPEYCQSVMKKEELDEQFFDDDDDDDYDDDDAATPSITIFSYEPAPPEVATEPHGRGQDPGEWSRVA